MTQTLARRLPLLLIANVQADTEHDAAEGLRALGRSVLAGAPLELEESEWAVTQGELLHDQAPAAGETRARALYAHTETPEDGGVVSLVLGADSAQDLQAALNTLADTLDKSGELDVSAEPVGTAYSFLAEYSETGEDGE